MAASQSVIINTHLMGVKEFLTAAGAEARALGTLAKQATIAGVAGVSAGRQFNVANQALFTLRRITYGATLAMGAAAIAATKMGFSYDLAMQEASVALDPVFDTQVALNEEMSRLFRIAAFTPFQFKDITVAFRQMYAAFHPLGLGANYAEQTIKDLTDALSFAGKATPASLQRVSLAMQHLAFQGHLTGYAVNQLSRDGIPLLAILRNQFHLTGEEIHRVGTLGIPVTDVLAAIHQFIKTEPGFAGAAARQASMTLVGVWSTFKDLLSQALGGSQTGMFGGLQQFLTNVNEQLKGFSASKPITLVDFLTAIDKVLTPKTHTVLHFFDLLKGVIDGVRLTIKAILAPIYFAEMYLAKWGLTGGRASWIFQHLGGVLGGFIGVLILYKTWTLAARTATILWTASMWALNAVVAVTRVAILIFNGILFLAEVLMGILGAETVVAELAMLRFAIATALASGDLSVMAVVTTFAGLAMDVLNATVVWASGILTIFTSRLTLANLALVWQGLMSIWTAAKITILTVAEILAAAVMAIFSAETMFGATMLGVYAFAAMVAGAALDLLVIGVGMAVVAFEALTIAIMANPIGFIAYAILLLIAILPLLYWKWSAFHKLVDRTFHWIVSHWKLLAGILLAPVIGPIALIILNWRKLWNTVRSIFNRMIGLARRVASVFRRIWSHIPGQGVITGLIHHIPFLQAGGHVTSPGISMVGERGPEMVMLPAGASVIPNHQLPKMSMPSFPESINLTSIIKMDGKTVAKQSEKHKLDAKARE